MNLAFLNIGTQEMMLIIIVILFLFGGKKLPELARGLGRGIREFKDASDGIKRELSDQINSFERDLDVEVEEPKKSPVATSAPTSASMAEQMRAHAEESKPASTVPQFTTPAETQQHNPSNVVADVPMASPTTDDSASSESKEA
ncbi:MULTISPECIES: Sec-independent protein translocase subunit TatA/TatB [Sphingobacterium]|uniref:Sec-independent protein translocase protein TatA n=1 Tax=Sphingobacterium populi TaxID=1812824 RepID=A0ABW5U7E4_9SPHI|nr:twin-arginine translocase TatA/TatE family subunit [Sphingobacterium sp. CFCC 11742]